MSNTRKNDNLALHFAHVMASRSLPVSAPHLSHRCSGVSFVFVVFVAVVVLSVIVDTGRPRSARLGAVRIVEKWRGAMGEASRPKAHSNADARNIGQLQ